MLLAVYIILCGAGFLWIDGLLLGESFVSRSVELDYNCLSFAYRLSCLAQYNLLCYLYVVLC
jgi:hypothetical protein